jgi:pimeloyl-ACP methyl ester carboxylesterase
MLWPPRETDSPPEDTRATVDDWRDLGDLLALATERLTSPVEGIHDAIADRWFRLAGSAAAPAQRAYRAATAGIYRSIRLAGAAVGAAIGFGAAMADKRAPLRPLGRSTVGSGIQAVGNALWGDELEPKRGDPRAELGLRSSEGELIGLDAVTLGRAFPEPTSRLVVLLHGLGETERCWQSLTVDGNTAIGLAGVLAADSFTPLLVRYNSGRHVSDNGLALATLIDEITHNWPVPVGEIALVGNSMGGLVARSSVHAGRSAEHHWVGKTSHIATLGSPHLGAPLEKGANVISWGLRLAPESRPLGVFLNQRSAGIKDLRFGAIREEDWIEQDPDAVLIDAVGDAPLPGEIDQHFIAGVVTAEPTHPVGALLGDFVVRAGSAIGRGRRRRIEATDVRVLGGRRHFDMLHDPVVQEQVRDWLSGSAGKRRG